MEDRPIDTLDQDITEEEAGMVQIPMIELETLKWTLDTLTTLMKDMDARTRKTDRDLADLASDVNLMKSPIYAGKLLTGKPSVG